MITRFLAYRLDMDSRDTHNADQKNSENEPQFEGVIFSDGTCVLRWLTPLRSHSVWQTFQEAMGVHGHPEYGTEILFYENAYHQDEIAWWEARVAAYKADAEPTMQA